MGSKSRKALVLLLTALMVGGEIQAKVPTNNSEFEAMVNQNMSDRYNIIEEDEKGWIEVNLHISYYTGLACENSSLGAVDARGNSLVFGTIAIPRDLPLGTEFKIDGYDNIFYGKDRGSKKYIRWINEDTMKIDMFIPRIKGESDSAYYRRVNNMGITKTKGRYKKEVSK